MPFSRVVYVSEDAEPVLTYQPVVLSELMPENMGLRCAWTL